MPRPKNKTDLLQAAETNFNTLLELVNTFPIEQQMREFPKGTLNRNVRDVLGHLQQWHVMLLQWYKVGIKGRNPEMPAKGYTWRTLPALNTEIWKQCQNMELEQVQKELKRSFKKLHAIIVSHSDEELFQKKRYSWTGSTSLAEYLISNTSSHYNWAIKLIKKAMK